MDEDHYMKIIDVEQGSPEWLVYRRSKKMASEAAALMGCAPWFPRTAYELFEVKSGRREVRVTPAMARGVELEARARALYEVERGDLMVPYVVEGEEDCAASLDGLSWDGDRLLEVKCPWKGSASDLWARAARGQVPAHYQCQMQMELMASGAELADFAVYAWDTHALTIIEVRHDLAMQARIRAAWDAFWPDYAAGRAPGEDYIRLLKRSITSGETALSSGGCDFRPS